MSIVPSLPLWSSIKIPLSESVSRKKREVQTSRTRKSVSEVVNLRVPSRRRREAEDFSIYCVCEDTHVKRTSSGKKFQEINLLIVPGSRCENIEEEEFDCIPTVKPWTLEELRDLNRRYDLMGKKTRTKNKQKEEVKDMKQFSRISCCSASPTRRHSCDKSTSKN